MSDPEPEVLDLEDWKRREHFEFFRHYEKPWFNICADVDVTVLVARSAEPEGPSFFLASLWLSLVAANEVEPLRYRLRGDQVVVHPVIHGGSTVLMPDETFAFAYFDFQTSFAEFAAAGAEELEKVKRGPGGLNPKTGRDDMIHYSIIPWVSFTSFSHARTWKADLSVPKIVFGRHRPVGDRHLLPVSVEVHHALVDGLHVGRFYQRFEELAGLPDRLV
ncbi:MAG: CatA-like O-acetyltransferase [Thermoanaerobaculia bacterium]